METSLKKLEILLKKTDGELDHLSYKVDQEFYALAESKGPGGSKTSPSEFIENVHQLREELNKVQTEVEDFQRQQQELMNVMQKEISTLCCQFDELSKNVPQPSEQELANN